LKRESCEYEAAAAAAAVVVAAAAAVVVVAAAAAVAVAVVVAVVVVHRVVWRMNTEEVRIPKETFVTYVKVFFRHEDGETSQNGGNC
jgi:uncharacterized membrane protein YgcG